MIAGCGGRANVTSPTAHPSNDMPSAYPLIGALRRGSLGLAVALAGSIWPLSNEQTRRYLAVDEVRREQGAILEDAIGALDDEIREQFERHYVPVERFYRPAADGAEAVDSPVEVFEAFTQAILIRRERVYGALLDAGLSDARAREHADEAVAEARGVLKAMCDGGITTAKERFEAAGGDASAYDFRLAILENDVKRGYRALNGALAGAPACLLIGLLLYLPGGKHSRGLPRP